MVKLTLCIGGFHNAKAAGYLNCCVRNNCPFDPLHGSSINSADHGHLIADK